MVPVADVVPAPLSTTMKVKAVPSVAFRVIVSPSAIPEALNWMVPSSTVIVDVAAVFPPVSSAIDPDRVTA